MTKRTHLQVEALEDRRVPPTMLVPDLDVRLVATGLVAPPTMAFLGPNDFLVLEKISGKVQRVTDGLRAGTALDLPVNNYGQRGLLGIDGDGIAGGDHSEALHRLFGDSDGDGDVDEADRDRFRSAFHTSAGDPGYFWYFDLDGDVDGRDNG